MTKDTLPERKILIAIAISIVALLMYIPTPLTNAANISGSYLFLSRIKGGLTSGVEMILAVTPGDNTNGSDSITLEFPDAEDGDWCITGGGTSLTVAGVSTSIADGTGDTDITAALPGTLTATCAAGSGAGSVDTITISGVNALTSGTTYGVQIAGNLAALGTPAAGGDHIVTITIIDGASQQASTYDVEILSEDQVNVTATVSDSPTVSCSLTGTSGALDLGTLYKGGTFTTATHTFSVTTSSSASGYYTAVYGTGDGSTDAGLYDGSSYLIASDYATGTMDLTTGEGYGLVASTPSGATVASDFSNAVSGTFGAIGLGFDEAKMLFYQTSAEATGDTSTITHGAAAGASAATGTYNEYVTFICGGYY